MALIKCPECGKEMSSMALQCPNCGYSPNSPTVEFVCKDFCGYLRVFNSSNQLVGTFSRTRSLKIPANDSEYTVAGQFDDCIPYTIVVPLTGPSRFVFSTRSHWNRVNVVFHRDESTIC